ncbi:MAG: NAD(P)-dependent oxidoreductase [Gammaproteobacteria bacterium]
MNEKHLKTGVIGLGAMGAPMARNLARAGLLGTVWNRTRARADELATELGVPVADSPAALADCCDVILTCVSADEDLEAVVRACEPGLRAGQAVVDTSTVNPATARKLAAWLEPRGVAFVDAPVSGGVEGAKAGTLSVMAGGDSANLSRIAPVLEAISARITHMGGVGAGQATKAVNQVMVAGIAEAVCEGLALAEKLNLPPERLINVLSAGAAGSWFLDKRGLTMLQDRFAPGFKSGLLLKDLRICEALARELDMNLPMVEAAIEDYAALVDAGHADSDTSVLIELKRPRDRGPEHET